MSDPSAKEASPLEHAVAGSLASAIALVLFYPLERARVELQAQASSSTPASSHSVNRSRTTTPTDEGENSKLLDSVDVNLRQASATDNGDNDTPSEADNVAQGTSVSTPSSSSSSWSPVQQVPKVTDKESLPTHGDLPTADRLAPNTLKQTGSDSRASTVTMAVDAGDDCDNHVAASRTKKMGLIDALKKLHAKGELYQGVTPVMTTIFASQFVFFFMNAYFKHLLRRTTPFFGSPTGSSPRSTGTSKSHSAILSLVSSSLAGIGNVLFTNPLWVVNMSIMTGQAKSQSLFRELLHILRTRGFRHLWNGTSASILLVSNPVIQFFCYEQFKQARLAAHSSRRHSSEKHFSGPITVLPPLEAFVGGAISKGVATVTTYPLQLAQTVLRLKDNSYKGTMDCLVELLKRGGYKEWFTGMRAKLLQTVLTAAFTFLSYEQILGAVEMAVRRSSARQNSRAALA